MNSREAIYRLLNMRGVAHTTLNPYGPGVVRIHLVPPKFRLKDTAPSVAVLNGRDIIPINLSWAILLYSFLEQVNRYEGREVTPEDMKGLVRRTLATVKRVYPRTKDTQMKDDLWKIVNTLTAIASGKEPGEHIGYMTLSEYAPFMAAPHRMDLMISAMTQNGQWHCNQQCLHCYAAGQAQAEVQELPTHQWKHIIDRCKKIGVPQLTFTGGEPTMRKDLPELIAYAKWFVTRLNTNGAALTEQLCEELYEASLDSVQITLYSAEKAEHNSLTGANNFHQTVDGIRNALGAGLNVSVNTPLCKGNTNYVETLRFLDALGIKYVSCSGLIVTGNALQEASKCTQLSEDELYAILTDAAQYCEDQHIEISFTSPGWVAHAKLAALKLAIPSCGACLSNMAISPDGGVVPCQSWLSEDVLGNILRQSWSSIWNAPKCREIRDYASTHDHICPLRKEEA